MASFNLNNSSKPTPQWWVKLENGLLIFLIPATVTALMNWKFTDELLAQRLIIIVNICLVALIKFIGMMLGEEIKEVQSPTNPGGDRPKDPPPNP